MHGLVVSRAIYWLASYLQIYWIYGTELIVLYLLNPIVNTSLSLQVQLNVLDWFVQALDAHDALDRFRQAHDAHDALDWYPQAYDAHNALVRIAQAHDAHLGWVQIRKNTFWYEYYDGKATFIVLSNMDYTPIHTVSSEAYNIYLYNAF